MTTTTHEWYAIFFSGWMRGPARGPFHTIQEADAAFTRWYDRQPQRTHDNANARATVGEARIVGPYRTRREALKCDINDPLVKLLR